MSIDKQGWKEPWAALVKKTAWLRYEPQVMRDQVSSFCAFGFDGGHVADPAARATMRGFLTSFLLVLASMANNADWLDLVNGFFEDSIDDYGNRLPSALHVVGFSTWCRSSRDLALMLGGYLSRDVEVPLVSYHLGTLICAICRELHVSLRDAIEPADRMSAEMRLKGESPWNP